MINILAVFEHARLSLTWFGTCEDTFSYEMTRLIYIFMLLQIVSTFPKQWFTDLDNDKTIPQLEGLCRFLNYAVQLLEKALETAREIEKKDYK